MMLKRWCVCSMRQKGGSCRSSTCTYEKGKGYLPAEENPAKFHGTGPFHLETGDAKESKGADTYTEVFSKVLLDIAKKDERIVAITAAMADGTGLTPFAKHFPNRFLMWGSRKNMR